MNAKPDWISVFHHEKPMLGPWFKLCGAAVLLCLVLVGVWVLIGLSLQGMKAPELQYNPRGEVVKVYDSDGKMYTPQTDPLFKQRVKTIIKQGNYDRVDVGLDGK